MTKYQHSRTTNSKISVSTPVSYFHCVNRLFEMYREVRQQEKQIQFLLKENLQADQFYLLTPPDIKRITKYWQLGRNVICSSVYELQNKKLSEKEEKALLLVSVFSPFFDDLLDEKLISQERLDELVSNPLGYSPAGKTDRLVQELYLSILSVLPSQALFIEALKNVLFWQKASLRQLSKKISEEELREITYKKSYSAVLLYCSVLEVYPSPEIRSILYPVAGLMQLTNDVFDVWKDVQKQVFTLPNRYLKFEKLQGEFFDESAAINKIISELDAPRKAKQNLLVTIHALPAMGLIALDQLSKVTALVSEFEELAKISRKELVCDMDSWPQKIRWLRRLHALCNL